LATVQAAGILLTSILFGMIGYYLTLIAKFYRLKFSKGPPHRTMQVALALLIVGLLSKLPVFAFLPSWLPPSLVCAGGLAFSGLAYSLYRTMMSVD
jgi:hypothetical protein